MRIGVDVGGTKIEAIALDSAGEIVARRRIATPRGDYDGTLDAIAGLVRDLDSASNARVGVCMPGALSPATGLIKNANSTWLIDRPFDKDLARVLDRPVRLNNDANCFTLSEATDGAGAGGRVVFGVILGTGVGGGIVVNGAPLTGPNAIAGEWGHNPLPWPRDDERPGPECYCGRSGCIETFLSGPGLARDHRAATGEDVTPEVIVARAGDTITRYTERLARALAHVINLLDPDVIVLGGGLSNIVTLYDVVPALWSDSVFSDHVATRLVRNSHGDSSGVRGAAWLWPE